MGGTRRAFLLSLSILFLSLTVLDPAPARAAEDRLLFWQVKTKNATVYLLGSMHLATRDIYPLRQEIMQAFEGADKLAVELDISGTRSFEIQQRMLERGQYPPGKTLQDDLSPETWKALSTRLESNGLPPVMMQGLKPGLVVTTLSTVEMMKLGLNPEQGVDRYFLDQARGKKPVIELETVDRQLDVLLDSPDPELLVKQSLGQLEELDSIMEKLVTSWRKGDAKALAKLVIEDELAKHPEYADLYRRMFDDRNRDMTDKIVAMQQQGGTYFVVVGAGHLVGDQGIVAMLKRRGQSPRRR